MSKNVTTTDPAIVLGEMAARRRALLERQELVDAAPVPRAEAQAKIDGLVERAAADVDLPVHYVTLGSEDGTSGMSSALRRMAAAPPEARPGPFELMCAVAGDAVRGYLTAELEQHYAQRPAPMTAAERAAATAEIAAELAKADRAAAEAWWGALDRGQELPVPEGVSAAAMLGLDD